MTASATTRVLIVDDDKQVRRLLERLLERNGYACSLAADVGEAARLLATESVAVVLCDVKMPAR